MKTKRRISYIVFHNLWVNLPKHHLNVFRWILLISFGFYYNQHMFYQRTIFANICKSNEVELQGWQSRSSGKFTIWYLVFLRKRRRWAFLNTLQALDPPTFKSFGLTFLYETTLSITYLLKNSEISTLFGSSPVLRHNNACGWNV